MFKNYFILNKLVIEFNSELKDYIADQIFSQEKEILVIRFVKGKEERYLEISVNPGFPFITLKSNLHRAKKNTIDFFKDFFPDKLSSFEIASNDRIIKIAFKNSTIFFAVRGKYSNIYLIDKSSAIHSFKKNEEEISEKFAIEAAGNKFINTFNLPDFHNFNDNLESIKKHFPFIGKEILLEAKIRASGATVKTTETITEIINKISNEKVIIFHDENERTLSIGFESFISVPFTKKQFYNSVTEAVNAFINQSFYLDEINKKKKIIEKYLTRELNKLADKINNLKEYVNNGSKEELFRKLGDLLLINLNQISTGQAEIVVENIYENGREIKIKLNKTKNAKQNAEMYFQRAKEEKIKYKKSEELLKAAETQFNRLYSRMEYLAQTENLKEINQIMKELKIKIPHEQKNEVTSRKFRHYRIEGKYDLYVGKDSKSNDLLTTKFAKQNDIWFHARSVSGSHVVLRISKAKEIISRNILKKAASIAAYYSKAKTSSLVPVSFTQKKYVVKKKGMEAGKVALLKEEVLLVKPEIPSGCEYEPDEAQLFN